MAKSQESGGKCSDDAQQIFTQFAWNVAGALTQTRAKTGRTPANRLTPKRTPRRTIRKAVGVK